MLVPEGWKRWPLSSLPPTGGASCCPPGVLLSLFPQHPILSFPCLTIALASFSGSCTPLSFPGRRNLSLPQTIILTVLTLTPSALNIQLLVFSLTSENCKCQRGGPWWYCFFFDELPTVHTTSVLTTQGLAHRRPPQFRHGGPWSQTTGISSSAVTLAMDLGQVP